MKKCPDLGNPPLDDVLVASKNMTELNEHLHELFACLVKHGLIINPSKCALGKHSIDFLGHHIDGDGIIPLPGKVQANRDFPRPSSLKGLQEFTGMVNFYRRFICHYAELMQPLFLAVAEKSKPADFIWTGDMDRRMPGLAASDAMTTLAPAVTFR